MSESDGMTLAKMYDEVLAERDELRARVQELEAKVPKWVSVHQELPTEQGVFWVMQTDEDAPIMRLYDAEYGTFAGPVTHWLKGYDFPTPPEDSSDE